MTIPTKGRGRESFAGAIMLLTALGLFGGWLSATTEAEADHPFGSQCWASGNGCIGWKQFAVSPYASVPVAHMDNGGSYCGESIDYDWADAIVAWNGEGTVASFEFARSDCVGVSYPGVRVVPYTTSDSNPDDVWRGRVFTYDRDPNDGSFDVCWSGCSYGTSSTYSAQKGYDLSEVLFNLYYSSSDWEWVSRHELGHVLGLADDYTGSGCNGSYIGLMDNYLCHTSLTAAEKAEVDSVHNR